MAQRIRHMIDHNAPHEGWDRVPRGWITSEGRFLKTKEHWASISAQFRKADTRSRPKEDAPAEAEEGERNAHLAYGLGWISVGHGGMLNAIGHERTFRLPHHPAVTTLRKILSEVPHRIIQVETQVGEFDASRGVHEHFVVKEYSLDILLKFGRLRQCR